MLIQKTLRHLTRKAINSLAHRESPLKEIICTQLSPVITVAQLSEAIPVRERQIEISGVSLYILVMISKIPQQPKEFDFILKQCSDKQAKILKKVRHKILEFDERLREYPKTRHIRYGITRDDICSEIKFEKNWNEPRLFLKLPIPKQTLGFSERRGRMSFGIESIEYNPEIIHHQRNTNNKSVSSRRFITSPEANKTKLEMLLDMALEKWLEKNQPGNN